MVLNSKHRAFKKHFETEIMLNGLKLSLNHFVQETIANIMVGFLKTLKGTDENTRSIEAKITKLSQQLDVDAHSYP